MCFFFILLCIIYFEKITENSLLRILHLAKKKLIINMFYKLFVNLNKSPPPASLPACQTQTSFWSDITSEIWLSYCWTLLPHTEPRLWGISSLIPSHLSANIYTNIYTASNCLTKHIVTKINILREGSTWSYLISHLFVRKCKQNFFQNLSPHPLGPHT